MDDSRAEFRRVNPILDARPRFGPIPADLILPWGAIAVLFYTLFQGMLQLGYLWTILMIAWGCGTWWLLTGSKPYRFLSKFVREPRWCRGYVRYQTIAESKKERFKYQLKQSNRKSKRM
jgi:hypothetical protein